MNVVIASSSIDGGIGCWDLQTGAEQLRYKTCASPPHGLTSVGCRFLACSQLRDPSATSGHLLYWSWSKPQAQVKSFPAEPIKPLIANSDGTYIVGGGSSGDIYIWEVATGRLLKKWHAHYRAITCLVFSEDDSLLISGSEDGCVRVWSLFMIFDDVRRQQVSHLYEYSFTEHTLRVTDIVIGYGGGNAIIVSASEDRTCKLEVFQTNVRLMVKDTLTHLLSMIVWSLSKGRLLRNVVFPSIIDAIAIDPGEHVFYAGSRDGKIYVAALNAESSPSDNYGLHIIGSLTDQRTNLIQKSINSVSSCDVLYYTHPKHVIGVHLLYSGPVNNIVIVRLPYPLGRAESKSQPSSRKHELSLPPSLEKYANSTDEDMDNKAIVMLPDTIDLPSYLSSQLINDHIKQLQQQGSSAVAEMEAKRLKADCQRSMEMFQQLRKVYDNLQEFCVNELLDEQTMEGSKGN
ncbi:protein ROOT INITIATION DEFECTIVE 3 [Gossypium australe]|uniref:Protein ROOT INITIATION DEFECTIVE 3 n=1 Tax=Gossypium australe TaxID=47621 RepID=A0A5B6W529_9ROSI|nr:protein ROOT INITIATION DEFECTIVE 3 [Gossypium australe]